MNLETERKFLIEYPDEKYLENVSDEVWHITQTYIEVGEGKDHRVRKIIVSGKTVYTETKKRFISGITREENEREIREAEYNELFSKRDTSMAPLEKTRYRIPYAGKCVEIDVYPFFTDRAVLEVELENENEEIALPEYVTLIKEITNDKEYRNTTLAKTLASK